MDDRAPESPLATYLREISATPLLSAEEEQALARKMRDWTAPDAAEARDRLIRANLLLVVSIAKLYANNTPDLQDLIGEGNLGLLRAIELFDPERKVRFSTYATYWIKQAIGKFLAHRGKHLVRVPTYMLELVGRLRCAKDRLRETLGRPPTHEELAAAMRVSVETIAIVDFNARTLGTVSLEEERDD